MRGRRVGRYRVVDKVGNGGVGEVFRAIDDRLERVVALKFLHERLLDDTRSQERFRREALITASLSHPNVCTIFDTGSLFRHSFAGTATGSTLNGKSQSSRPISGMFTSTTRTGTCRLYPSFSNSRRNDWRTDGKGWNHEVE